MQVLRLCCFHFNPRPPWGGRRLMPKRSAQDIPFQSTPSVGRATIKKAIVDFLGDISIHALRGEGDRCLKTEKTDRQSFQSTPSVGRATIVDCFGLCVIARFQSTPSVGRATDIHRLRECKRLISIHALRGEGDQNPPPMRTTKRNFNTRPPWGGRPTIQ